MVCDSVYNIYLIVNPSKDATILPTGPFCIDNPSLNLTAIDVGGIWSGNGIIDSLTGV